MLNAWLEEQSSHSTFRMQMDRISHVGNSLDRHNIKNLKDKYFFLTADKSTNINNITELTNLLHFVYDRSNIRKCLCVWWKWKKNICRNNDSNYDDRNKTERHWLKYLVACAFDGAVNFLGTISGVQRKISEMARREIPYFTASIFILTIVN